MKSPFHVTALAAVPVIILNGSIPVAAASSNDDTSVSNFPIGDFAAHCEKWDEWDKPAQPFRIHGGTYHVGTCGITAILIASTEGHLLIDRTTATGSKVVAANIEALGFSLSDVRYLTHTQEHFDHVGGHAYLKNLTGAQMLASSRAKSVFETGVVDTDDPQFGMHDPMAALTVDKLIQNSEAILLDDKSIVAQFTPGHSPGAISWRWQECQDNDCRMLVFTDGMGPVSADSYRWTDYPEYLADYRASLAWLETVEADICLSAHPSQMRLIERIESGSLVDSSECARAAAATRKRLDRIIETQSAGSE